MSATAPEVHGDRPARRRPGPTPIWSIASQGVFAANSLIVTVVAAWQLDARQFGRYSVMFGVLALVASVSDALIGEIRSLRATSMDAHLGGSLVALQVVVALGSAAVCALVGAGTGMSRTEAAAAALTGALWALELGIRRFLSARLAFRSLIANDAVFAVAAVGAVLAADAFGQATLTWVLLAWAAGAAASTVVGLFQLTPDERTPGLPTTAALHAALTFGTWRVLQAALRPLTLLAVRLLVAGFASLEDVAQLELGRLLVAPITVASAGASQYLLPALSRAPMHRQRLVRSVEVNLAGGTIAYGFAVLVGAAVFADDLRAFDTELRPTVVAAWMLVALAMATGVGATADALIHRRERWVFGVRLVDNAVGLAAAALLAASGAGAHALVGVGAAGLAGSAYLISGGRRARAVDRGGSCPEARR